MKKGIVLSAAVLTLLCGCGKIPTNQNGEQAVITFKKDKKEHVISVEDLYKELKNNFGLEATIKLIDNYILETEFSSSVDETKEKAENYIKAYIEAYGGKDKFLEALKENTNYTTIEGYQERIYLNLLENKALEEYAKTLVSEKEIKKYYDEEVKGDVELYHILVTSKATDEMSDKEKTEAEEKAKATVEKIIKNLKKSDNKLETFKELVKKYSEDKSTNEKDGYLGFLNYGDLNNQYDEILDSAFSLKDGDYSKSVITSELGYHVIYRVSQKEKEELKDIKDSIIKTLSEEKIAKDNSIYIESVKYYRKLYNLNIVDSELNRQYGIYMNSLINNTSSK